MNVSSVMTKDVEIASPDTSLREAAAAMRDRDTGLLPIGENDRLIGTVTDRDIVVRGLANGGDPASMRVRDVMSEHILYCYEDQDIQDAAAMMGSNQVRRLAVLNRDKRLVGMVSLGDIATHEDGGNASAGALKGVSSD